MSYSKELMVKFLTKNYPVCRLKHNKHFKRTLVLETGEKYHLSNKSEVKILYTRLFNILDKVFYENKIITEDVLRNFLNLKQRS